MNENNPEVTKAMIDEFLELQKKLKKAGALPKAPKAPKKPKRSDDPDYQVILNTIIETELIELTKDDLDKLFTKTITEEKPQGQKWLIFKLEGKYSLAFLNNEAKKVK